MVATVKTEALIWGNTIRQKVTKAPQPSISAALSISAGIDLTAPAMMKVLSDTVIAQKQTVMPGRLLLRFRALVSRAKGIISA